MKVQDRQSLPTLQSKQRSRITAAALSVISDVLSLLSNERERWDENVTVTESQRKQGRQCGGEKDLDERAKE